MDEGSQLKADTTASACRKLRAWPRGPKHMCCLGCKLNCTHLIGKKEHEKANCIESE